MHSFRMTVFFMVYSLALMAATEPKVMHWTVGGVEREAFVYIPESAKLTATPIVFVFHGHGGNMNNILKGKGIDKLWPEAIIVSPQGLNTPGRLTDPKGELPGWQKGPGDMNDRDLLFFDAVQSLRTVGIESIRIFVFSVLKKSTKEINFFLQRGLLAIYFSKKRVR